MKKIANNIFQAWEKSMVTPDMQNSMSALKKKFDSRFNYHFYDIDQCRTFIIQYFDASLLKVFDSFEFFKDKINIFKYCILYIKGGYYIDPKCDSKNSVFNVLNKYSRASNHDKADMIIFANNHCDALDNIVASIPNNPILMEIINEYIYRHIIKCFNCDNINIYNVDSNIYNFVLTQMIGTLHHNNNNLILYDALKIIIIKNRTLIQNVYKINNNNIRNVQKINNDNDPNEYDDNYFPFLEVEKKCTLINNIDIFVSPSHYESFISVAYHYYDDYAIRFEIIGRTKTVQRINICIYCGDEKKEYDMQYLIDNPIVKFDKKLNIVESEYAQKIPKTIYYYSDIKDAKTLRIPISTFDILNPEYSIKIFDEFTARKLIQDHFDKKVLLAYDILNPYAYKCDLWRYCVLYIYGGIYLDDKLFGLVPFRKFVRPIDDLVLVIDQDDDNLFNGIMGCVARHNLMKMCIDKIVDNVISKKRLRPLEITGPILLGSRLKIFLKHEKSFCRGYYAINDQNINLMQHPLCKNRDSHVTDARQLYFVDANNKKIIYKYHGIYKPNRKYTYDYYHIMKQEYNDIDKSILNIIPFDYDFVFSYDRSRSQDLFAWRCIKTNVPNQFLLIVKRNDVPTGWKQNLTFVLQNKKYSIGISNKNIKYLLFGGKNENMENNKIINDKLLDAFDLNTFTNNDNSFLLEKIKNFCANSPTL